MSGAVDEAEVFKRVSAVIAKVLDVDEASVKMESDLVADLGADSIDRMTLVMALEDAFQQRVPEEDLPKLTTVGRTVTYIAGRQRAANASSP
ncbi:MAG: acyl carrier protein [Planctomycetaceae bacterium]